MKNVIVSLDKLPTEVKSAIDHQYPHGYDHATFEFKNPIKRTTHVALKFEHRGTTYMVKLETRETIIDTLEIF